MQIIPQTPSEKEPLSAHSKVWVAGALRYTSLGLISLCFWLLWGDFVWNLKERAVSPLAPLALKQLQASDMLIGLLVGSLPAGIGLLLGPVVGVKSDRYRSRWGRRIPFILICTPFITLSMSGLAFASVIASHLRSFFGDSWSLNNITLAVFGMFWGLFEVATIITNIIFMGLINDVVPEKVIGKFFGLFRSVSLIAGIIFNYWILGKAATHMTEIFLVIGFICSGGIALMCLKVKEGAYPSSINHHVESKSFWESTKSYIGECYTHSYYLWIFLSLALANLAAGPVNSFSIFYAKSLGIGIDLYGKYIAITFTISLGLSYFIGALADRFHPLRVALICTGAYSCSMLGSSFLVNDPKTFAWAFITHGVISGCIFTGSASLTMRLFPKEKFGQLQSAAGIMGSFCYMILPPTVGKLLDISGHDYRLTFLCSGVIASLALISTMVVFHKFIKYGGPKNYVAPE